MVRKTTARWDYKVNDPVKIRAIVDSECCKSFCVRQFDPRLIIQIRDKFHSLPEECSRAWLRNVLETHHKHSPYILNRKV